MHSPLAIANEFIKRALAAGKKLTPMQLQKLLYLAHGWNLAVTGNPLIDDKFEAWEWGPVNRRLYEALRAFGAQPVDRLLHWGEDSPFSSGEPAGVAIQEMTDEEGAVIDRSWRAYGDYPAFALSALTHEQGTPWAKTYRKGRNRAVSNNEIQEYFIRLADPPT